MSTATTEVRGHEFADGLLLPSAEWYGKVGWQVFPCYGIIGGKCGCGKNHAEPKDVGKHPYAGSHGSSDATDDLRQIDKWWSKNPDANIAVMCKRSGFIVVDVDPRNDGFDSWEVLEGQTGGMPATVEATTGEYRVGREGMKRGRHLFYTVEDGEAFWPHPGGSKGLKGIDIKHDGYVMIAPSRHGTGRVYEWLPGKAPWERKMTPCPEELLKLIRKKPRGSSTEATSFGTYEWGGEKMDVDAILAAGIQEGERNNVLFRMTLAIANDYPVKKPQGEAVVKNIMKNINAKHVFPPLNWELELEYHVQRAIDYVKANPKENMFAARLSPDLLEAAKYIDESGRTADARRSAVTAAVELTKLPRSEVTPAELARDEAGMNWVDETSSLSDPDSVDESGGGDPGKRSMTDVGNGRRIIDRAGSGVRYTRGMGWFVWNGSYWEPDSDGGLVQEIAKRLPIWIAEEVTQYPEGDQHREDLLKWGYRAKGLATRKNAIVDASVDSRIRVRPGTWDSNPDMLGVKNGVINLRTGTLLAPDPGLYVTKQSRVAYTAGHTHVMWDQFIEFATGGDKDLQRYLQLAAGYTLTGNRDHECLFLVYGPAGSGKSTLLEVIGTLLGDYYMPMDSDVLVESPGVKSSTEYHMAQLMGKRMIGISEWPSGKQTKEETIKRLTGDLTISARHPGERPFSFESQAKLWIGTNVKPQIKERAMWRRIRAINFSHVPERPDPALKPFLLDPEGALPAALAWAVEGAIRLLNSADRSPLAKDRCRHVLETTTEYMKSENRIGLFLAEETVGHPGGSVNVKDLFAHYRLWVEERGEMPPKLMTFHAMLGEEGEVISGAGNAAILHERTIAPRSVPTAAGADWGSLVNSARRV